MNITGNEDLGNGYELIYKDRQNIIAEFNFDSDEERIMCESIIESLENTAAREYAKEKCVSFPFTGKMQTNILRKRVAYNYKEFKQARETMTTEEYSKFRDTKIRGFYKEQQSKEANFKADKANRNKYFMLWNLLARRKGFPYANCYIKFLKSMSIRNYNENLK